MLKLIAKFDYFNVLAMVHDIHFKCTEICTLETPVAENNFWLDQINGNDFKDENGNGHFFQGWSYVKLFC